MQASTTQSNVDNNLHDIFTEQPELDHVACPSNNLAPNESYSPFIPYILEPQHEDNISIDMIKLYQVCTFFFKKKNLLNKN